MTCKHYDMNILAHTANRFIQTLGKHELQPNERTLAKDKAYDLAYFEKKTDAGKLVLSLFIAPMMLLRSHQMHR